VTPQTKYAKAADGVAIAYQVVGDGPRDLVWVQGFVSHIEAIWEEPSAARFLERLASFSRLILFDKRGTGMSDRVALSELPTLEQRMSDVLTVCDAVGSERAALLGVSEGAPLCILFAATYPARTTALILLGGFAREMVGPGHPWGNTPEGLAAFLEEVKREWGGPVGLQSRAPSRMNDERFRSTWARYLRMGASPSAVLALTEMNAAIDVRPALSSCRVPTLVIHRTGDLAVPVESGRYLAKQIPGAKFVELPGVDHIPWVGDSDAILEEIEEFLTGVRHASEPDRVLATVLFTDMVGSTQRAATLGDKAWGDLLAAHHRVVREQLERFGGHEVDTAGDGFLARFEGPARAIRCALAIADAVKPLGLEIRAGVHTGEVQLAGADIRGLAIHIGARIAALAGPGEVLVSRTVKDLVAGSGLSFKDGGTHVLKGVPDEWQLFAVGRV
jgi:class 3 adenylate cyclase/pimeloyl-ACP methyl ester carboxylesterase